MAHQSDTGYASRIRTSLAVTVTVFAISLSYWGIFTRQQSQADTIGTKTINFDDRAAGEIGGSTYPDISITSNGQPRAALYPINNPSCPGFRYPSSPNALYIPQDTAGGNSILKIAFADGQVSDTVSLQIVHYTTTVNIKAEALDSTGAVIDAKMTNPPGGSGCANTPFTFSAGAGTGIAAIRIAAVQPEASSAWGIDDFSYGALHVPISNFDFSLSTASGPAPLTITATYTGTQANGLQLNWDFGDGQTMQNGPTTVTHTYTSTGTYIVKLTSGSFSAQKTVTVATTTPPPPTPLSFSVTPAAGVAPLIVTGTGPTPLANRTITWSWGDSSTPEQQTKNSLSHTYTTPGSYAITVTQVDTVAGQLPTTQSAQKTIIVSAATVSTSTTTGPGPTFTYTIDPTSGTAPLTIKATVTGTGAAATTPLWDFGDGSTATGTAISHTYQSAGTYTATVRIGSQVGTQQVLVRAVSSSSSSSPTATTTTTKKLTQTGVSLSLTLLIAFVISGALSYLIIRRPFHS